jgi:hypothetical protein
MMGNDIGRTPPPLPPAIEAMLAHERELVPTSEMIRARAVVRARESLREADVVVLAPRMAPSRFRQMLFAAAASILLLAGGAAAYQMLRQPEPSSLSPTGTRRSTRATAAHWAAPTPEPVAAPEAAPEPVGPGAGAASAKTPVPSHRAALSGKHAIAPEELRLLDRARRADARGDYLGVLAVAAEHERKHPTGRLAEEREALRVKALVGLGRGGEARQVAANFRNQFPRSVLRHKIEDMLASLR